MSKLLLYFRVELKTGKKTDYFNIYTNLEFDSTHPLSHLVAINSTTMLIFDTNNTIHLYPNTEEAKKDLKKMKEHFLITQYFDGFNVIATGRVDSNLTGLEDVWNVSTFGGPSAMLRFSQSSQWYNPREKDVLLQGHSFKKVEGGLIAMLDVNTSDPTMFINILLPQTGRCISSKPAFNETIIPLISTFDNGMLIALFNLNELKIVEALIPVNMPTGTEDIEFNKMNPHQLEQTVTTTIKVGERMLGIKMIRVVDKEYVIIVVRKSVLIIEFGKLERWMHNSITKENTVATIRIPEYIQLRDEVIIEYNELTRSIIIIGYDILTIQLP